MTELVYNLAIIALLIGVDIYIISRMASELIDLFTKGGTGSR